MMCVLTEVYDASIHLPCGKLCDSNCEYYHHKVEFKTDTFVNDVIDVV